MEIRETVQIINWDKECYFKTLIFFALLYSIIFSQDINWAKIAAIKADPDYVWGSGISLSQADARNLADEDLVSRIQVSIAVTTIDEQSEESSEKGISSSELTVSKHRSYSGLYLKGLSHLAGKEGKNWNVFAYIHKDSLAVSFQMRKNKLRSFIQAGLRAADEGNIGEALRNYYWGYLLAKVSPDTINFNPVLNVSNYPENAAATLIKKTLQNIRIIAEDCYQDGEEIIIPLQFGYQDQPINNLYFNYYSGMGTEYALVEDSRADIPIYDQPVASKRKLTLSIEYKYVNEMESDPEIRSLNEIFKENRFRNLRTIKVHFPWIDKKEEIGKTAESDTNDLADTEILDVLIQRRNLREFFDILQQYQKLGFLVFGKRSDFGNGQNSYVAICDDSQVIDILFYDGKFYRAIQSGNRYASLSPTFKGKKQLWFKGQL